MYKIYVTYVVNRNPFAEVTAIYTQTDKGTKEKVVFWILEAWRRAGHAINSRTGVNNFKQAQPISHMNVCRTTVHIPRICSIEAGKYFRIFSVQRKWPGQRRVTCDTVMNILILLKMKLTQNGPNKLNTHYVGCRLNDIPRLQKLSSDILVHTHWHQFTHMSLSGSHGFERDQLVTRIARLVME